MPNGAGLFSILICQNQVLGGAKSPAGTIAERLMEPRNDRCVALNKGRAREGGSRTGRPAGLSRRLFPPGPTALPPSTKLTDIGAPRRKAAHVRNAGDAGEIGARHEPAGSQTHRLELVAPALPRSIRRGPMAAILQHCRTFLHRHALLLLVPASLDHYWSHPDRNRPFCDGRLAPLQRPQRNRRR
jgi:hypothetical protein